MSPSDESLASPEEAYITHPWRRLRCRGHPSVRAGGISPQLASLGGRRGAGSGPRTLSLSLRNLPRSQLQRIRLGTGNEPWSRDTHSWGRRRLLRLGASSLPLSVFLQSPAGRLVLWHAAVMTASPSPRSAQASRAGPDPAEYGLHVGGPLWSQGTGTRSSCPALGGERKGPFRTPESESGARPLQGPFRK